MVFWQLVDEFQLKREYHIRVTLWELVMLNCGDLE